MGWALVQCDWYPCRNKKWGHIDRHTNHVHAEEWPCEDTVKRWPSVSQGERLEMKPVLRIPWSQTSSLKNCEKINLHCLSQPVCSILLWHPQQTNTLPICIYEYTSWVIHSPEPFGFYFFFTVTNINTNFTCHCFLYWNNWFRIMKHQEVIICVSVPCVNMKLSIICTLYASRAKRMHLEIQQ